ncbi:DMT family transporter [Ammoniphilus sp. CFH 90114]|uniref:EamA family transporter n=1 Tax=Ammoniphilus sp. CFH 90114 TaxID=2493665 RepID=UPI00100DB594|nr:DMT family transporter [Ammoniphilus sp. CFH 90114]RXT13619.1 DMT family transporter [Ammoniphilus sp. CFH 90114]
MTYWRSVSFVLVGASCYGVLSTIVKTAYSHGFTTAGVTGSQMLFGVLLLLLLTIATGNFRRIPLSKWGLLTLAGMFVGLTGILYYGSLQTIPASLAIVLLFQFTWIGVLMEAWMERKWPQWPRLISLILLFFGTLLAGNVWHMDFQEIPVQGLVFGLLAAFCYAGFIFTSGRLAVDVNPWLRSFFLSLGSLIIVFIVFPPTFIINGSLGEGLWLWGLLLAVLGIVLPNLLFTYGVPQVGSGMATILSSVELPMAVFMSHLILKEQVSLIQWLGVLTIVFGIVVAETPMKKRAWRVQED